MTKSIRPIVAVLLGAVGMFSNACARAGRQAPAAEVILEIYNNNSYWVNASLVSATATTPLGRVGARETRRWALPAQSGNIHVSATDSTGTHSQVTTLDPGKGSVLRWEVRE